MEVRDFLEMIFQESEGFLCAAYGKDRDPQTNKYKHWREHAFKLGTDGVDRFLKANDAAASKGWDCFFAPAVFSASKRISANVLHSNVLWADFDSGTGLPEFSVAPSLVVQSSGGKHHVYWNLNQTVERKQLEELNRGLAYAFDADKSGWDGTQLLRAPNTINYKYDPPQPVVLKDYKLVSYPVEKFTSFLMGSLTDRCCRLAWKDSLRVSL